MALEIEHALLTGEELHGLSLDWWKCFDSLPRGLTLELWSALGAPDHLDGAIKAFYDGEQRCFSIGKVLSEWFSSNQGYFQGDPLAMFLQMSTAAVLAWDMDEPVVGAPDLPADFQLAKPPKKRVQRGTRGRRKGSSPSTPISPCHVPQPTPPRAPAKGIPRCLGGHVLRNRLLRKQPFNRNLAAQRARYRLGRQPYSRSYADDMHVLGRGTESIKYGISKTCKFEELTRMELNVRKCYIWSTTKRGRAQWSKWKWKGQKIKCQLSARVLCAGLTYCKQRRSGVLVQRKLSVRKRLTRLGCLPLSVSGKGKLAAASAISKALYGCETATPPKRIRKNLRTRILRAIWGKGRTKRAAEIVFGLHTKGHLTDPKMYIPYQRLSSLRRLLTFVPESRAMFETTWHARMRSRPAPGTAPLQGMLGLI